ncbi:Vegetative incompatibility protein HET-E-1 [Madurella mycetomatis]|uniref:Vegetative incompatibility protein HET-E-1 n=1 Tax=Madurella mycetomatis TaxID=100816 RepID=A0A175WC44_9PEZI|nr:Vegetative incompatibility protein HET-E-1 [Madurella mycetomatis]
MDDRTPTKGGLLRDLYRWILDNADFRRWRDDLQRRLLWIKGDAGKGKTMLLCGIINELESTANDSKLFYFFCQGTNA